MFRAGRLGAAVEDESGVAVQNVAVVAGSEAVQAYVTPNRDASVWQPERGLKAFENLALQPGEARVVEFEIDFEIACSYWDEKVLVRRLKPATYGIAVDSQTSLFCCNQEFFPESSVVEVRAKGKKHSSAGRKSLAELIGYAEP